MLSDNARARLSKSWAPRFLNVVYPVLLRSEDDFAVLYDANNGRPTWSVARMLGLVILREMQGLRSDQEAVDGLAFDVRWQQALGFEIGADTYLSCRSLEDFRARLAKHDPDGELMAKLLTAVANAGIEDLGLSARTQRLDSTFVQSNIRRLGRVALLNLVADRLVDEVKNEGLKETLKAAGLVRDKSRWPSNESADAAVQRLADTIDAVECEGHADTPRLREAKRVLDEHAEPNDEPDPDEPGPTASADDAQTAAERKKTKNKNKAKRRARKRSARGSLQTPHDPDALIGRKGLGYSVQIAETSGNDAPEMITHVAIEPANASDLAALVPTIDALTEQGLKPEQLLADAGYGCGDNILDAAARDVELLAPVPRQLRTDFTRDDFHTDAEGTVLTCPMGHPPERSAQRRNKNKTSLYLYFDRETCDDCVQRDECPVRVNPGKPQQAGFIDMAPALLARDERLGEQRLPSWRETYRARGRIESTNSELKRKHHLRKLSVRGLQACRTRSVLKAIGCNAKRICAHQPTQQDEQLSEAA